MADVMPNLVLEKKKLEVEKDSMKLNLQRSELRILELEDEKDRIAENQEATRKEIANMEKAIEGLQRSVDKQPKQE